MSYTWQLFAKLQVFALFIGECFCSPPFSTWSLAAPSFLLDYLWSRETLNQCLRELYLSLILLAEVTSYNGWSCYEITMQLEMLCNNLLLICRHWCITHYLQCLISQLSKVNISQCRFWQCITIGTILGMKITLSQ